MGKRVKKIEQVAFVNIEEVSFEEFDQTMSKIVQAKPLQTKPPKKGKPTGTGTPARPC